MTSFSRELSMRPVDALKTYSTTRRVRRLPQKLPNLSDYEAERGGTIVDVLGSLPPSMHQLSNALHASGHMTHLHARRLEQPNLACQGLSLPSMHNAVAKTGSSNIVEVPAVHEDTKLLEMMAAQTSAHAVNLKLNPASEFSLSQRVKDTKPSPRFIQIPKYRYSVRYRGGTPRSYSEDSVTVNEEIRLIMHGQTPASRGRHVDSKGWLSPSPSHLVSESPDYMLVDAKFAEGHLILTDREGMVTQRLRESESEANFDRRSIPPLDGRRLSRVSMSGEEQVPPVPKGEGQEGGVSLTVPTGIRAPPPSATMETVQEGIRAPPPSATMEGIRATPPSATMETVQEGIRAPPPSATMETVQEGLRAPPPSATVPEGIRAPPPSAAVDKARTT